MDEIAITVVGPDRPGIVADVSARLAELGLNLTDSTMTLLRGHFAMMLVCAGAADISAVEAALASLDMISTVRLLPVEEPRVPPGRPYTLVVHGADRLGIVAAVTGAVARAGGNITDLTTRLAGDLYVLTAEIDVPPSTDVDALGSSLAQAGRDLGVEVSLHTSDADLL